MPESYSALVRREPMLVGYWRQNDAANNVDMADYGSRYNLTGTYSGRSLGPALIQGDSGAGSSSVATGYGEVSDASPLHVTGDISIEAWIFSPTSATANILSKQNAGATQAAPYALQLTSGVLEFSLGNGSSSVAIQGGVVHAGIPTHVFASSFRGVLSLYVNGDLVQTGSLGSQTVTDAGQPLYIGTSPSLSGVPLLAEVALYDGALSARRIARHFVVGQQVLSDPAHYSLVDPPVAP